MNQRPYDWNRRPLGASLPRGGNSPRRRQEPRPSPPPDRRVGIIIGCVLAALGVAIGASFLARGSPDSPRGFPRVAEEPWDPIPGITTVAPNEGTPDTPVEVAVVPPPADLSPTVSTPVSPSPEVKSAPPPPEIVTTTVVKKTKARKPAPKARPTGEGGENKFFTLELSGTLGGEELDPEDSQTWARISYFLRSEARSPHYLVYPDGSIPVSSPQRKEGKTESLSSATEEEEPEGDTSTPTYRLVIDASASEGGGVTFYRQKLGRSFRSRVSCRIEKRTGDEFKLIGQLSADESTTLSKDSSAEASTVLRSAYDLAIEKLLKQLGGQRPFVR